GPHAGARPGARAAFDPRHRHARSRARGPVHGGALGAPGGGRDVPSVGDHGRRPGRASLRAGPSRSRRGAGRRRGASGIARSDRRADERGSGVSTLIETRSGSGTAEVRELRERFVPKGLHVGTPVVVARALGAEVFDPEGRRYLDFVAGIGALNLGHQHPDVIAAVREQLERYAHVSAQVVTYEPYVRLAEALDRIYPRGDASVATKSVFANSGAEAVENAIKIARVATGREWIIAFQNSFHGRTYTAMTATGKTKNSRMAFMRSTSPNVAHVPYP